MKKTLVAICCVITMVLAIPFASYAREANDTTLFINSDSTDIYSSSVKKVFDKTFSVADSNVSESGWSIKGDYEATNEGLVLNATTASAIASGTTLGGEYMAKYCATVPGETMLIAYFNYKDASNYYSVEIDTYDGKTTVKKVVGSSTTKLVDKKVSDLVVSSSQRKAVALEIEVKNGDNISVWYTIDGIKAGICENIAVSGDKITSGYAGVGFKYNSKAAVKYVKAYKMPESDISNVSNTVKGKVVCYKDADVGSAVVAVAFYKNGRLEDIFTENISVRKGFNDFSVDVKSEKNLAGTEVKCFLFDSMSNIKPLVTTADNSSYRNEGFSDELEPYYPMFGTYTKTTDEMYNKIANSIVISNSTEKENADRLAVIDMYRKAGFDLTADMSTSVGSKIMSYHAPQTYSTLTPKPLMGDYEHTYSIDAPWNNPIPAENPRTQITAWVDDEKNENVAHLTLTTVLPKGGKGGNGLGIPMIIADENDGFERFADLYSTNNWINTKGHNVRVPEDYSKQLNDISYADRHAIFIDDTTKTTIQTWHTVPSDSAKGYNWSSGLIRDFDARSGAFTSIIDLTGIGNEAHAGVNAAGIPMDAITVKKSDINDENSDIKHALGAAFGVMMKARVYPAYDVDSGAFNNNDAVGCVPYGGIVQLDPSIDLEGIYAAGKLSLPGYKILKAWRDYGIYNVDRSSAEINRGHMLLYTSVTEADWLGEKLKVPYTNNTQGSNAVQTEIEAFLEGDAFFGLSGEPVACYVTTPVVKHTSYDANEDGVVDEADSSFVSENISKAITMDNLECDVNKDGKITSRDAELITKYLNKQYPQTPKTYSISGEYTSANRVDGVNAGIVNITGIHSTSTSTKKTYQIREGEYYGVAAVPSNGFVFDSWANEELAGVTSNVITAKATSSKHYDANFVRAEKIDVVLEKNADGEGKIFLSANKDSAYVEKAYGLSNDIKYANWQCAFKAEPEEGYVFESWEVTSNVETKSYHSSVLNIYINASTTIKANFKKANAYDTFDTLNTASWSPVVGSTNRYYSVTGGKLYFASESLWNIPEYIVLNNDVISLGNTTLRTTVNALTRGRNNANIIFGYKDASNYWEVRINSTNDSITLYQKKNGTMSKIASFEPDETDALDVTAALDVHIKTTSDGKVSVYAYQGEDGYILVQDYEAGEMISGYTGLGTTYGNGWYFDNFAVIAN